ncbi:hypothetical protein [Rhodomicrobium sp.]|uniref:hypothetical protein n=1 Tax=Rhodomicrobium sp. TaxID=2720632 RepID=UPI0039E53B30
MIFTRAEIHAALRFALQARTLAETAAEILHCGGDEEGAERMYSIVEALDVEVERLGYLAAATPIGGRA